MGHPEGTSITLTGSILSKIFIEISGQPSQMGCFELASSNSVKKSKLLM